MANIYNDEKFFEAYAGMPRSRNGLCSAGEWHQLQPLFPNIEGKKVLDLGCGYVNGGDKMKKRGNQKMYRSGSPGEGNATLLSGENGREGWKNERSNLDGNQSRSPKRAELQ